MDVFEVRISRNAQRDLNKVPMQIREKFFFWVSIVAESGLLKSRLIKGYHDEPLCGLRCGQRSIRLNKAYRAFYVKRADGVIEFVEVIEVNKHEY